MPRVTTAVASRAKSLLRLGHLWFWVGFLKGALIFSEQRLDPRKFGFYGFTQFRMSCEIIKDCRHRFRIDQESLMTYIRQCIGFHAVRMIRKIGGFRADSNSWNLPRDAAGLLKSLGLAGLGFHAGGAKLLHVREG